MAAPVLTGITLREALRGPLFWTMAVGCLSLMLAHGTITAHLVPMVVWKGATEALGAQLLTVHLLLGIPVVVVAARATDRFDGPRVLAVMAALACLGSLVFLEAEQEWGYWLALSLLAPSERRCGRSLWAVLGRGVRPPPLQRDPGDHLWAAADGIVAGSCAGGAELRPQREL